MTEGYWLGIGFVVGGAVVVVAGIWQAVKVLRTARAIRSSSDSSADTPSQQTRK
jgi:hypothetical protein